MNVNIDLPASQDTERSILGAILLDNDHFYEDCFDLTTEDFHLDAHRKLYAAMNEILNGMIESIDHVDLITLVRVMDKQVQEIGGVAYIASLTEGLPRTPSIRNHVSIVKDLAAKRRLIRVCSATLTKLQGADTAGAAAAELQAKLVVETAEGEGGIVKIASVVPEVRKQIEAGRKISDERKAAGLTWGLEKFDDFTKGAFHGDMTVILGESGGYKTAFIVQMLLANGREDKAGCLFSIEMRKDQVGRRFYPAMGDFLKAMHIRDPRLMNLEHLKEMDRLDRELNRLPIWIDDRPQDIHRLIARMRMMRRMHDVELFGVDYFQLISNPDAKNEFEAYRMNAMALKEAMKGDDLSGSHLVVLSQYAKKGRGVKARTGDDTYGGVALKHAAQNVLILKVENAKDKEPHEYLKVDIDVDKQRNGPIGRHECMLDRDFLRFLYPQPVEQKSFGGMK